LYLSFVLYIKQAEVLEHGIYTSIIKWTKKYKKKKRTEKSLCFPNCIQNTKTNPKEEDKKDKTEMTRPTHTSHPYMLLLSIIIFHAMAFFMHPIFFSFSKYPSINIIWTIDHSLTNTIWMLLKVFMFIQSL